MASAICFAQAIKPGTRLPAKNQKATPPTTTTPPKTIAPKTMAETVAPSVGTPKSNILLVNPKVQTNFKVFKSIKAGALLEKEGTKELTVVSDNLPPINQTRKTTTKGTPYNGEMCTTDNLTIQAQTNSFEEFSNDGVPSWMKPGIIIQAGNFVKGQYTTVENYERSPITMSITLNGQIEVGKEVKNPSSNSALATAVNELRRQNASTISGIMNLKFFEVSSAEELGFKLTGKYSGSVTNIAANLNIKGNKQKYYYAVEFTQIMFGIEVDGLQSSNVFINGPQDLENYLYVSQVNYGRRGLIIYESERSLQQLGSSMGANFNSITSKGSISAQLDLLKESTNVKIHAFFYGGDVKGQLESMDRLLKSVRVPDASAIMAFANSRPDDYTLAVPIGYQIKNLNNERVGMKSSKQQTVTTCVPWKNLKLKVTLSDVQSIVTADSDKKADLGVAQHILYKANGKAKVPAVKNINLYPGDCPPGLSGNTTLWPGAVSMICGNSKNQIHVVEGSRKMGNINNSIVFHISPDEFYDSNAEFLIHTEVKEYNTSKDILLNLDPPRIKVAIKEVLSILNGIRPLQADSKFKLDDGIAKGMQFDYFNNNELPLANVGGTKIILEGPIRARNNDKNLTDKAAVWVRFELID